MNPIQKQLLVLGASVMLVMLICPPWTKITHLVVLGSGRDRTAMQTESQDFAGYSLLWAPPAAHKLVQVPNCAMPGDYYETVSTAFDRFLLQWLTAAFLIGAGLLFFKDSDEKSLGEWWSKQLRSSPLKHLASPAMPPSETKQATERNKISAWRRASEPALKAFGIGAFAGIAGAYRVQSDFSLPERILFALCCAALGGLLCVVPTYLVAVLSNTRREPTTTIRTANRKRSEGVVNLILPGIIGLAYVFWLFGKSQETRETHQLEEVSAPAQTEKASAPDGQVFERQPIVSSAKDEPWPDNQAQAAAEFEKEFFVRYPDLRPYKAIVDAVALKLQEGGYKPENRESIMETYAKAAREEVASRQQIQNAPVLKDETLPSAEASPADSPAVEETPGSQFILGSRYLRGEGVEQDYVKAAYWFRKAAEQDDPRAQNNIGVMFQTGRGVRRDDTLAYAWFSIAAQQGDTNAMRNRDELTGSLSQAQLAEARRRAATLIPLKSNPK